MNNPPESECRVSLPGKIQGWIREDKPQIITEKSIFDYMDGAGELYIGYRFLRLDVYTYKFDDQNEIAVELYWMKSSDDAFGLLSQDWGGEPKELASPEIENHPVPAGEFPRALYGAGLLRIWSDNLYARVMATQETSSSQDVVMAIGRAVLAGRSRSSPPKLLTALPSDIKGSWSQRSERLCFLRSHLVMNSVYFLSTENLLDLGLPVEAISTVYDLDSGKKPRPSVRFLLVRYPGSKEAQKALGHFMNVYLPEKAKVPPSISPPSNNPDAVQIEDGWLGYQLSGRYLILVFESPDRETATSFVENCKKNLHAAEESYD